MPTPMCPATVVHGSAWNFEVIVCVDKRHARGGTLCFRVLRVGPRLTGLDERFPAVFYGTFTISDLQVTTLCDESLDVLECLRMTARMRGWKDATSNRRKYYDYNRSSTRDGTKGATFLYVGDGVVLLVPLCVLLFLPLGRRSQMWQAQAWCRIWTIEEFI
jgi:hypothetical protein